MNTALSIYLFGLYLSVYTALMGILAVFSVALILVSVFYIIGKFEGDDWVEKVNLKKYIILWLILSFINVILPSKNIFIAMIAGDTIVTELKSTKQDFADNNITINRMLIILDKTLKRIEEN